jgi:hypothetical protein
MVNRTPAEATATTAATKATSTTKRDFIRFAPREDDAANQGGFSTPKNTRIALRRARVTVRQRARTTTAGCATAQPQTHTRIIPSVLPVTGSDASPSSYPARCPRSRRHAPIRERCPEAYRRPILSDAMAGKDEPSNHRGTKDHKFRNLTWPGETPA